MNRWVTGTTALLLALISLTGCDSLQRSRTVARIGAMRITVGEFRDHYARGKSPSSLGAVPMDARRKHLEQMIDARLKYIDGVLNGMERDSLYQKRLQQTKDRLVLQTMMRKEVLQRIIPERVVKRWYGRSNRSLKIKHILLSTQGAERPADWLRPGARAWKVYDLLREGASFDSLAKVYSDDKASRNEGGAIGWLQWGRYPDEVYDTLFRLKQGGFTKPIRTEKGYEIFYVEQVNKVSPNTYNVMREQILSRLRSSPRYADTVRAAQEAFIEKVAARYGYAQVDFGWNLLSAQMKIRKALVQSGQAAEETDQFAHIGAKLHKYAVARWRGDSLTIGDIISYVNRYERRRQPDLTDEKTLRSWVQGIARTRFLTQWAYEKGYDKHPEVVRALRNYALRVLPVTVDNKRVRQRIEITEQEIRDYYEAHREAFVEPPAKQVREILVDDYDLAEELVRRARSGEDFVALAHQFNQRRSTKEKDGLLGWLRKDAFGEVGKRSATMKVGEVAGPIRSGVKWSVIRVEGEMPERQKTLEEVRREIENRIRGRKENELRKKWLTELREKYRPVVYERALESAFPLPETL